jgi:hypothetical protein
MKPRRTRGLCGLCSSLEGPNVLSKAGEAPLNMDYSAISGGLAAATLFLIVRECSGVSIIIAYTLGWLG